MYDFLEIVALTPRWRIESRTILRMWVDSQALALRPVKTHGDCPFEHSYLTPV
jgi:hypothetical protein